VGFKKLGVATQSQALDAVTTQRTQQVGLQSTPNGKPGGGIITHK
jgi:hypothetical protein